MRKINVCIIGAGGTMGYKTSRNLLRKQDKYELSVCEIDPDAIGKLEKIGLHVTDMDAAVPNADVVVPAINDSGLKALAPKVLACMKPGAAMVMPSRVMSLKSSNNSLSASMKYGFGSSSFQPVCFMNAFSIGRSHTSLRPA